MVVIWRYSPDSRARPVRALDGERGAEGGDTRKCDDYAIGKECQAGGEDGYEKVS